MRFCDLKLSIERSPLARHVRRLYQDLERRGLPVRPHVWLSEEWFSPDGVPGIAVPFYLAHPRLERLERRIMREAEGGNTRLLRCASCATRPGTRSTTPTACAAAAAGARCSARPRSRIPARYRARAGSRRYVQHLGEWYAQAHPTRGFRRDLRGVAEAEFGAGAGATPTGRRCTSWRSWTSSWRACAAGARRCATATLHRAAAREHPHAGAALPPQAGAQPHVSAAALADELLERVFSAATAAPRGACAPATLLRAQGRVLTATRARARSASSATASSRSCAC